MINPNNKNSAAGALGNEPWVFTLRRNPVKPFNGVGSAKGFPLAVGKTVECQQLLSRLFQAYYYLGSSFFPLHNKCSIRFVPLLQGLRIDNLVVIAFHFFQSMPRYMPLHIAQLMHRAALHLD